VRAQKVRTLIKKGFEDAFANGVHAICDAGNAVDGFRDRREGRGDPVREYLKRHVFTVTVNMRGTARGFPWPAGLDAHGWQIGCRSPAAI